MTVPSPFAKPRLLIRPARPEDEASLRDAVALMGGWAFASDLRPDEPFSAWLGRRAAEEAGDVGPDRVPSAYRVAVDGGVLLGRSSIRFSLNERLARHGGHVGYGVLPEHRGRGVATALLKDALAVLAERGVRRALVTCDDTNLASAAVAERCGGVLDGRMIADTGVLIRHYLLPTVPRA